MNGHRDSRSARGIPAVHCEEDVKTRVTALQRAPSEYLRHNVSYTFSGFNWTPQFLELLLQVGVERMMFSSDYPYGSMTDSTAFLIGLSLAPSDRERIAHGNAESLLNI